MALNGADSDAISFKTFLDISYALLVDEYRTKAGMNLIAALEETKEYRAGPATPVVENVERKNTEALAQLENMMKGVR